MNQFTEDHIDPNSLRKEVSLSIIDGQMTNNLAIYLMRIHDIVRKKHEFFRQCSQDEIDEAVSWSLERWVKGFGYIDLTKYENPFSYFYRGTYLNMLNRIQTLRHKEGLRQEYENEIREAMREEMPTM